MLDLTFLRQFTKGNEQKMKRYLLMYLEESESSFHQMEQSLQEEDWESLRVSAHSLKPQAELIGIQSLKSVLMDIEDGIQSGNLTDIEELVAAARSIHEESAPLLQAEID